uniref:Tetratricopeptide repeat protein n=1 Tax=Alexandrium catenella TaxID=2925 RepID=A0A7S1MJ74_ALECA|mmetsp:Transcript_2798/g.7522  ORF Transcript_2798/g.7522 Transcript_2798/m.7522 type:complete len:224 (+) Transcript_2798:74-745(+)
MSRASTSTSSCREDNIAYFMSSHGLDRDSAQLLHRGERLQEKGQLDQALLYFRRVLDRHPGCVEARTNVTLITDFMNARTLPPLPERSPLPGQAEISWYGESAELPGTACEHYHELKRLPNGRSEFTSGSGLDDEIGGSAPKIVFPPAQSDLLWREILDAIEDGSGLSDTDPNPFDLAWGTVGERMAVVIDGGPERIYYTNNSPVDRALKKHLKARRTELGYS